MKPVSVMSNNRTWLLMAALVALMLLPGVAMAGGTGDMPYEKGLTVLIKSITGPVAFAISVIGVVAAGAMLIFGGDMNGFMRSIVFLILVIGLIVSASSIMEKMFGKTGAIVDAGNVLVSYAQGLC